MVPSVDNYYLGSIVTMFPISKPKYTVMVCVAKQVTSTHPTYYGISLTGSTARTIMEYIYTNDLSLHATLEGSDEPYVAQSIKAGTSNAVKRVASEHAILADPKTATTEWSRASVAANGEVTLSEVVVEDGKVPNVLGMGLSDALFLLESQGLVVSHTGQGRVISQSLAPNSRIENKGYMIHLTLER
jgi:cell division protein FtsI (penicillin-binding protein 3)